MSSERGSVTLLSIIMMLLISSLGATLLMLSKTDLQIAINQRDGIAAQYLAESGIQYAIAKLKTDSDLLSQTKTTIQVTTFDCLGATPTVGGYTVKIGPNPSVTDENTRMVTATGVVNQARRQVVANITLPVQSVEDSTFIIKWSN